MLTLRIQEPGQPGRVQAVYQLPALIGRGSASAVRLDSPFASRMPACIRVNAQGQPVLDATSSKGLRCTAAGSPPKPADDLGAGQSVLLPPAGKLVLTPDVGPQVVEVGFVQSPNGADHTATLAPPPGYPLPAPAVAASATTLAATHAATVQPLAQQLAQADLHVAQAQALALALAAAAYGRSGATTSAAAWVAANGLAWFNRVGDCRVWHWRGVPGAAGDVSLTLCAQDQTFTALSEDPPHGVPPHNPARMVGNGRIAQPEVQALQLQPGDGLLLSPDGLHDLLSPDELRQAIARAQGRGATLQHLGRMLARRRGSTNDIALIVRRWGPAGQTMVGRQRPEPLRCGQPD